MKWKFAGIFMGCVLVTYLVFRVVNTYTYSSLIPVTPYDRVEIDNIAREILWENGKPKLKQDIVQEIIHNKAWVQFIDEAGNEVKSYNRPKRLPRQYGASDRIELSNKIDSVMNDSYARVTSIVVIDQDTEGNAESKKIIYLAIGQPARYLKVQPFEILTGIIFYWERPKVIAVIISCSILFLIGILWGRSITSNYEKIMQAISNINNGNYYIYKENGAFKGIYKSLNKLTNSFLSKETEHKQKESERQQEIANIAYELRNSLSDIKGYTDFLYDLEGRADVQKQKEYFDLITAKCNKMELLVDDINLVH